MKTKRMKDGGLNLDDARIKVPKEDREERVYPSYGDDDEGDEGGSRVRVAGMGGRIQPLRKVMGGGRASLSIPIGTDTEIEAGYQGPAGSTQAAKKFGRVGVSLAKQFARGGRVGKKHPRDFSK